MSVQKSNGPIIDPALCRCCRAIKKCRILTAEYNWMGKKEIYADMVMDCYGILLSHVDDNEKDSGVCATCVVRLREAIAFRHQVLQCEELFLQAKLDPPEEEKDINYESKLKKMELELKTEPKDYSSDHNSMDDRDNDPCPNYSEDDAEDNKPLVPVIPEPKPEVPPLKDEEVKSEDSDDYNDDGSSSDSDEPIKKKAKRKAKSKANGAKKKPPKSPKKQKAETPTEELMIELTPDRTPQYLEIRQDFEITVDFDEVPNYTNEKEFPEDPGPKKKKQWVKQRIRDVTEYDELREKFETDPEFHFRYLNMSKESFELLHEMVEEVISKEDTRMRKSVSTRERLLICLRYYRSGQSFKNIAEKFRIGITTASQIIKEVSRALWGVLQPKYMPAPRDETWKHSERGFREMWNFPNCVGSIGGRHIIAKQSPNQEYPKVSTLIRHKTMATIALLAVTDPFNKILALDIGNYAMQGDSNILDNSKFFNRYMYRKEFLPPKPLPGETTPILHVLISDGSFTAQSNLLRPHPRPPNSGKEGDIAKKKFNYFLEKAYTVNATFDMLMTSWAALDRPMECHIEVAVGIVKAICCVHNFVLAQHGKSSMAPEIITKPWKSGPKKLKCLKSFSANKHRSTNAALAIREQFVAYFNQMDIDDPLQSDSSQNLTEIEGQLELDDTITEIEGDQMHDDAMESDLNCDVVKQDSNQCSDVEQSEVVEAVESVNSVLTQGVVSDHDLSEV